MNLLPEISTDEFEERLAIEDDSNGWLDHPQKTRFLAKRLEFIALVHKLIAELSLECMIDHLTVRIPDGENDPNVLYRVGIWPSKQLVLEIHADRYLDEQLLRHEFGHEADRHNTTMRYDPKIEEEWKTPKERWNIFNMAMNISLDARRSTRGLGFRRRFREFRCKFGKDYDQLFRKWWANPPNTWPEIANLATELNKLLRKS
jgi:hypothetical protein